MAMEEIFTPFHLYLSPPQQCREGLKMLWTISGAYRLIAKQKDNNQSSCVTPLGAIL